MSADHKLYYVVTAPPVEPGEEAAACLAGALGLSRYDAKLKLAAPLPQILVAAANRADAVELQMALDQAGVRTRCLTHGQIVHTPPRFDVVACRLDPEDAKFVSAEDELIVAPYGDGKVIVKARVRERTVRSVDGRRHGAILTSSRSESTRKRETSFVLHLFVAGPRVLRIAQHEFNYACLGGGMSMSSLRNFETLTTLLAKRFPEAVFDDSLCRASGNYDKVEDSYAASQAAASGIKREHKQSYTDERFVREAAWLIALTRSAAEW